MAKVFTVRDQIIVHAPIDRCFRLSTSIEIVRRELRMTPVAGRTSGFVVDGDTVLWQGTKFGLPQFHQSVIEDFKPYVFFRDRMLAGRFRTFSHDHSLELLPDGSVRMHDDIRFTMKWGLAGLLVGIMLIRPHIRKLLRRRFSLLKQIAESDQWKSFLSEVRSDCIGP